MLGWGDCLLVRSGREVWTGYKGFGSGWLVVSGIAGGDWGGSSSMQGAVVLWVVIGGVLGVIVGGSWVPVSIIWGCGGCVMGE